MKVMAFNGSPRKKGWNTVTLLEKALEGAASKGAQTELVQLYDLTFSGCISCFSCKKRGRKKDGVCAVEDDLTPVLERIKDADALIVGTPLYYLTESSGTRAFLERLCFPYLKYTKEMGSYFPRRINTALIYTMNMNEEMMEMVGLNQRLSMSQALFSMHFGPCELLLSIDTLQFADYDKYEAEMFDKEAKKKRHVEVFPKDCERAFDLGIRMASGEVS